MSRRSAALALALAFVPLSLAGCLNNTLDSAGVDPNALLGELVPAATPLWNNPQTAPHPMWGWPTLTNPATGAGVPEFWAPIPAKAVPTDITALELVASTGEEGGVASGGGMSVFGSLAVVPGYSDTSYVVDIRDPAKPTVLSTIEGAHRNVDFIAYPTGRLVGVFSTGEGILNVWDLTDPRAPVHLTDIEPTSGTHKVNVVPGTPIVYNANSNGGATDLPSAVVSPRTPDQGEGITEIYDLTDPENPVLVQDWANGFGCHHIYFWNNPAEGKYRAICAGIEFTQIWDIADPKNPTVIVNVPVHHGNPAAPSTTVFLEAFSHFAILNYAGNVLIVGDESGGGGFPPGCVGHAKTPARDVSTPVGALWFYDVTDETNPKLLGWFSPRVPVAENPPEPTGGIGSAFYSCTAHHGRLVPVEGKDVLAMAFYRAGVYLIDFTDPSAPSEITHFNDKSNTWEVQYYNGYLFTGDLGRGMDVLTFA